MVWLFGKNRRTDLVNGQSWMSKVGGSLARGRPRKKMRSGRVESRQWAGYKWK